MTHPPEESEMRKHTITRAAALIGLLLSAPVPLRAEPGIGSLGAVYDGFIHSVTGGSGENTGFGFTFDNIQSNGKFTGTFGAGSLTGKVSSTGKVTFTGTVGIVDIKGSGLLSATGQFLTGTLTLKTPNATDFGTFHVERQDTLAASSRSGTLRAPGTQVAEPGDLFGFYKGTRHSRVNAFNESGAFNIAFTNVESNGRFTGVIGTLPISGKLAPNGRLTFSGALASEDGARVKVKGSAHLSSSGRFLTGVFNQKLRSPDGATASGDSTFEIEKQR